MTNYTYIVLSILAFSLLSCGVKKGATVEEKSANVAQIVQTEQVETAIDTLPDFLKEFANDSTIHINWAYGIPFIIDDSVPMLLPPIDKNPQGYVCQKNYQQHVWNKKRILYYWGETHPIDTIPWLNKMMCDLDSFYHTFERGYEYIYYVNYVPRHQEKPELLEIELRVIRAPEATIESKVHYKYYYQIDGTLLGKVRDIFFNSDIDAYFSKCTHKRIVLSFIRHTDDFETWLNSTE